MLLALLSIHLCTTESLICMHRLFVKSVSFTDKLLLYLITVYLKMKKYVLGSGGGIMHCVII